MALHSAHQSFVSSESFWFPERLVPSAWLEHAPFAFWLVAAARPKMIVELGTHHGFSYLVFCQAVQRLGLDAKCYAVDTWLGDVNTGSYTDQVLEDLYSYHNPRYAGFSTLVRAEFAAAQPYFADRSIDILHIDGQHDYSTVRRDFEIWHSKLSDNAIVLFHDVNVRQDGFGVVRLWAELRPRYPSFAFEHGAGLGILGVGSNLPKPIAVLLAAIDQPEVAVAVSQAYSRLGAAVTAQAALVDQSAALTRLQATAVAIDQLRAERLGDAQRAAKLRDEVLRAKASEGRSLAALARLAAEKAHLSDENGKRDEVIRIIQDDAAGLRIELRRRQESIDSLREEVRTCRALNEVLVAERAKIVRWSLNAGLRRLLGWVGPPISGNSKHDSTQSASVPNLYAGVLGRLRLLRHRSFLSASPLFDRDWYLQTYPDVASEKLDPLSHFLRHGARDRRNPGPCFDTSNYLVSRPDVAAAGINPLIHYLRVGAAENQRSLINPTFDRDGVMAAKSDAFLAPTIAEVVARAFPKTCPFPVFSVRSTGQQRVTMVTDSLNAESLYGGVGTGLILSALLAKRLGATLRLLTRTETVEPSRVTDILSTSGIAWKENIEFIFSPLNQSGRQFDITPDDHFISTSWWTTQAMLRSVGPTQLIYLLQEDERMFYPYGDERLRCVELLNHPDLRIVINSRLLFDHLAATGVKDLERRAIWFEPAFPNIMQNFKSRKGGGLNFFFYARPNHARNLYLRGLEALGLAIEEGHLNPQDWTVYFVGGGGPVTLPRDMKPVVISGLSRTRYVALIQQMDAGLSLMYTSHPSYPPLDLAMAGAAVVTNRTVGKSSLDCYSDNIFCVDPDTVSLSEAIGRATALAKDPIRRRTNQERSCLSRDWDRALAAVLKQLVDC